MPHTVVTRRFWAVAAAAIVLPPAVGCVVTNAETLVVASVAVAAMVWLTWWAEASHVGGWPLRAAVLAVGVSISASLLPWTVMLLGWLLVIGFVTFAIETPMANGDNENDVAEPASFAAFSDDELDTSLVSSQTRRVDDGYETVEGVLCTSPDGPAHVVFHPPLGGVPEVELHDLDDCQPRLAEATPYGFRVTTKHAGRVAFTAAAPAA